MKNIKPKKGRLLISEPSMLDLNFKRSVLLITEHNDNESIAFILNQPTKIKIHDLFEDFPSFDANVHVGGPVEKNTLHSLFLGGDRGSGIYIFSGEPHFLERGHKIFEFSNILQARCACRMF